MRLNDKVAIVTGGASGIGAGIVRTYAREGAKVVICDLQEEKARQLESELAAKGYPVLVQMLDVSDQQQVEAMFKTVVSAWGTVDILVNNAGITKDVLIHKMNDDDWDRVIKVNLYGSYYCTRAAIPIMRDKSYGKVINISSISRFGNVGQANYAASKAGIVGLTRATAKEVGSKGINVNAVAPGSIATDMFLAIPENIRELAKLITPLRRAGTVEEVANVCLFLASDDASYITGQVIHCDGGMFMP
ncbi:MAG: 3-oxoacyl-ACP reductase FabG [Methylocystaceae bacterium]